MRHKIHITRVPGRVLWQPLTVDQGNSVGGAIKEFMQDGFTVTWVEQSKSGNDRTRTIVYDLVLLNLTREDHPTMLKETQSELTISMGILVNPHGPGHASSFASDWSSPRSGDRGIWFIYDQPGVKISGFEYPIVHDFSLITKDHGNAAPLSSELKPQVLKLLEDCSN